MTNWQECYKERLKDKSIKELQDIVKEKENEIKRLDKRTYNGKMRKIFIYAEILTTNELIDKLIKERKKGFSAFYPAFGNKNSNIRYYIHFENGTKKELKPLEKDIYYYNENRQKIYVQIKGGMWHENYTELGTSKKEI